MDYVTVTPFIDRYPEFVPITEAKTDRPTNGPVLVVGQGLAGTLLGWALEQAGRAFCIADPGHATSASRVGAGLVSPVTGERWAHPPDWREKATAALNIYRELEAAWSVALVHPLRIRREWREAREETLVQEKVLRGALDPWVRPGNLDSTGAWIDGAWRVDLPTLITTGRDRWRASGHLREATITPGEIDLWPGPVVWCIGAAETRLPELQKVGGETLVLEIAPAARPSGSASPRPAWRSDVVRHDGSWILPVGQGKAWAGATFVREEAERLARRETLRASVRRQLADLTWQETAILGGWRMTSPDRAPRSAWLPGREGREGVFNGLGSKGALLAPALAAEWGRRLAENAETRKAEIWK